MTDRAESIKSLINSPAKLEGTFLKYGNKKGTNLRATCLGHIKIGKTGLEIDHIWIDHQEFINMKLQTGNTVNFDAVIKRRKRPPESLYGEDVIDIKLKSITNITVRRTEPNFKKQK